jgi:hypothetical protein
MKEKIESSVYSIFRQMAPIPVTARSYLNSGGTAIPQPYFSSEVTYPAGDPLKPPQVSYTYIDENVFANSPTNNYVW